MQCHNTDVILSARFSNKLEPLLSLPWQYEEFTGRYLRSESETRGATTTQGSAFSVHAMAQTACVRDTLGVHHGRGVKTPYCLLQFKVMLAQIQFTSAARRMWLSSEMY